MPRLENWSPILFNMSINFTGKDVDRLTGDIYDDEARIIKSYNEGTIKFEDGSNIITSRVLMLDTKTMKAQTENTEYILGSPCPAFLEMLKRKHEHLSDYDFDKR